MPELASTSPWGRSLGWLVAGATLLACLYLPTLPTRFDFVDDGCLAYRPPVAGPGELAERTWKETLAEFHRRGPFRPVTWMHWEAASAVLGPHALSHRLLRLGWAVLAAGALLLLLRELGVRPVAALLAAALAMINPYRNEIWLGLGLTEAFAMPYALLGLVCAVRAARSPRPWPWDLAGFLLILAAIGCKNTFAVLVPAQLLLRLTADGSSLREGWRRHRLRACLLALALLPPAIHFVLYRLSVHPGQYQTGFSMAQVGRMVRAVGDAMSLGLIAPALLAAAVVLWRQRRTSPAAEADDAAGSLPVRAHYRPAILAGVALLICGVAIYSPLNGRAGRYTMPAVWGADLLLAVLLSIVAELPGQARRATFALFGGGLLVALVVNLDSQVKYRARTELLWQALEYVEREAPADAPIAWVGVWLPRRDHQDLGVPEGIHFRWHLEGRGRSDLAIRLIDLEDGPSPASMPVAEMRPPAYLLCGPSAAPDGDGWRLLREFQVPYRLGRCRHDCQLWVHRPELPHRFVTTTTSNRR